MPAPLPDGWSRETAIPAPQVPYPQAHWDWAAILTTPEVDPLAWIAPSAVLTGRVRIGANSSVWHACVLRGDHEYVSVGTESNVQDGAVLHVAEDLPCLVGNRVTIGHKAVVHGCVVEDDALIGIGALVLNGAVIGRGALIAAGAVVLEGTQVPPGTLWAGCPAKQIKELSPTQRERLAETWQHYVNNTIAQRAAELIRAES